MDPKRICGNNIRGGYCLCCTFDFEKLKCIDEIKRESILVLDRGISFTKSSGENISGWEEFQRFLLELEAWKKKNFKNIPNK
jgi:hypothetical protein